MSKYYDELKEYADSRVTPDEEYRFMTNIIPEIKSAIDDSKSYVKIDMKTDLSVSKCIRLLDKLILDYDDLEIEEDMSSSNNILKLRVTIELDKLYE